MNEYLKPNLSSSKHLDGINEIIITDKNKIPKIKFRAVIPKGKKLTTLKIEDKVITDFKLAVLEKYGTLYNHINDEMTKALKARIPNIGKFEE
jgi:hypothetical protein